MNSSKRGTNPNSLKNLEAGGRTPLYDERKKVRSISITDTAQTRLKAIANQFGLRSNLSELNEQIGRDHLVVSLAGTRHLVPAGKSMSLAKLPAGSLFLFGGSIALKTEYFTEGAIDAYIVESGERFWGGTSTAIELNALIVVPLKLVSVESEAGAGGAIP